MRAARLVQLAALAPLVLATACSGGSGGGRQTDPTVAPHPSSTCDFGGTTVPANCLSSGPPPTATGFPGTAAALSPVHAPGVPPFLASSGAKALASVSNDTDPATSTATFSVTVPAGVYLGADVQCLGGDVLSVDTAPVSSAHVSGFTCNSDRSLPSEQPVVDPTRTTASTVYRVTLRTGPSVRWGLTMFTLSSLPPS